MSDEEFEKFFFIRDNRKGVVFERWRHVHGCGRFFNAARAHGVRQVHLHLQGRRAEAALTGDRPRRRPRHASQRRSPDGRRHDAPCSTAEPHRRQGPAQPGARRSASPSTAQPTPALEGDTLASALLANGIHLVGPLVQVSPPARHPFGAARKSRTRWSTIARDAARTQPNIRATDAGSSIDGLIATSQNRWPSLAFDIGAVNDLARPFFSAGFYYKTFMWPKSVLEERLRAVHPAGGRPRRRAEGSRSRPLRQPLRPLRRAGGRRAARPALPRRWPRQRAGARVILCDEQAELGGASARRRDRAHRRQARL